MTGGTAADELRDLIAKHGEFNAYNIEVAPGVYTRNNPETTYADARVLSIVQLVADCVAKPFDEMRILDIGSLEGLFGLELAARGATVVGVEGREANVARAEFVTERLGLDDRVEWLVGDARQLSPEEHGTFDAVLCLGLLYHLDRSDQLPFLRRMAEVCRGVVIIDTHVSTRRVATIRQNGHTYAGRDYFEHDARTPLADRLKATRSSLDNESSFWLTQPSLVNALKDSGFSTVLELPAVPQVARERDRIQLVAWPGEVVRAQIAPNTFDPRDLRVPEQDTRGVHKSQDPTYRFRRAAGQRLPSPVKAAARQVLAWLRARRR